MAVYSPVRIRAMPSQNNSRLSFGTRIALCITQTVPIWYKSSGVGASTRGSTCETTAKRAILSQRLHQCHGTRPPDRYRQQRTRKDNGISYREDRQFFAGAAFVACFASWIVPVAVRPPWPQCTPGASRETPMRPSDSNPILAECLQAPVDDSPHSAHWANPSVPGNPDRRGTPTACRAEGGIRSWPG